MYLPYLDGISFTKEAKQDFHFSPNTSDQLLLQLQFAHVWDSAVFNLLEKHM